MGYEHEGEWVRKNRGEMTQQQLAEQLNCDRSVISRIENHQRSLTVKELKTFARVLKADVRELF